MTLLSPGVAYGCFNLLRIVEEHQLPLHLLCSEVPRFERIPTEQILDLCTRLNWIKPNDVGVAVLAPAGDRIFRIDDDRRKLRQALIDFAQATRPTWLALVLDGRSRFMTFAPRGVAQSVSEAYLAEGYEAEVVAFWDLLAAIARGEQSATLSAIGREGERLTLAHEELRTGRSPEWRSIESNADGYDVMSVVSTVDLVRLPIEVKTSRQGLRGTFHLTRNEWERTAPMVHHTLHLWDVSRPSTPKLAVLARSEVAPHIPVDQGVGSWKEVEVPFSAFASKFVEPSALLHNESADATLDD